MSEQIMVNSILEKIRAARELKNTSRKKSLKNWKSLEVPMLKWNGVTAK